jgi:VWFA-related protein
MKSSPLEIRLSHSLPFSSSKKAEVCNSLKAMRNPFLSCLVVSSLAVSGLVLCAQTPAKSASGQTADAQTAPAFKVKVKEVLLPVTVRDKKGALVTTLTASDFTLSEDSHPQTIQSLTKESHLPYRLGLLVETSRSMSEVLESERKAAGKFIDQMLADPGKSTPDSDRNQAFLIHFDREVELLEDFTSSRDKLHRELESMGPSRQAQNASREPATVGDDRESSGKGQPQSRSRRSGSVLYDAIFLAADELMKSKDGRKALVVLSNGADSGSKESLNDAVDAADRANLAVYTIYFKGEQERNQNDSPGGGQRTSTGSSWPGSGGSGWPGSGGGQRGGGPNGGGSGKDKNDVDGKKNLEKIATRTGGHFFEAKKKDNLEEIYSQIVDELRGQYLLTYTPSVADPDGGYHKITLKTGKDNLIVSTREGYYAPGKE